MLSKPEYALKDVGGLFPIFFNQLIKKFLVGIGVSVYLVVLYIMNDIYIKTI